ncbi:MAG: hypothetical protein KGJ80_04530 [Chloroflexota bacterium]|nr:hypothetical protein [Chloroflexota bacterium]
MRTIQTFVLRLLMDSDAPETLRGALRSVADGTEMHFGDSQALLALLRRLCSGERHEQGPLDTRKSKMHSERRGDS